MQEVSFKNINFELLVYGKRNRRVISSKYNDIDYRLPRSRDLTRKEVDSSCIQPNQKCIKKHQDSILSTKKCSKLSKKNSRPTLKNNQNEFKRNENELNKNELHKNKNELQKNKNELHKNKNELQKNKNELHKNKNELHKNKNKLQKNKNVLKKSTKNNPKITSLKKNMCIKTQKNYKNENLNQDNFILNFSRKVTEFSVRKVQNAPSTFQITDVTLKKLQYKVPIERCLAPTLLDYQDIPCIENNYSDLKDACLNYQPLVLIPKLKICTPEEINKFIFGNERTESLEIAQNMLPRSVRSNTPEIKDEEDSQVFEFVNLPEPGSQTLSNVRTSSQSLDLTGMSSEPSHQRLSIQDDPLYLSSQACTIWSKSPSYDEGLDNILQVEPETNSSDDEDYIAVPIKEEIEIEEDSRWIKTEPYYYEI